MRRDQILKGIERDGTAYIRDPYDPSIYGIHQADDGAYVLNLYTIVASDPITIDYPQDLGAYYNLDDLLDEYIELSRGEMIPFDYINLH